MGKLWGGNGGRAGHLGEEILLRHVDGGLSRSEDARAAAHLRECWVCRAARERLEETIQAFMEERRHDLRRVDEATLDVEAMRRRLGATIVPAVESRRKGASLSVGMRRALWPLVAAAALAAVGSWSPVREFMVDLAMPGERLGLPSVQVPARPPVALGLPAPRAASIEEPAAQAPTGRLPKAGGATEAELDEAEVTAHLIVHELGHCRWNWIEIRRVTGEVVAVQGMAGSREEAALLAGRLEAVAHVRAEIGGPEDARAQEAGERESGMVIDPRPPLLEARLKGYFRRNFPAESAGEAMAEYSNEVVRAAAEAHAEAQSLKVIEAAFPQRRVQAMSASNRARFARLVGDHWLELEKKMGRFGELLARLEPGGTGGQAGTASAASWPAWLERETARIDYLTGGLFAGLDLQGLDGESAWTEVLEACRRVQVWMRDEGGAALQHWIGPELESLVGAGRSKA